MIREFSVCKYFVGVLRFYRQGSRLASGVDGETTGMRDATTGEKVQALSGYTGNVDCIAKSPDDVSLAYNKKGQTITVSRLVASEDGSVVASVSSDRIIRLWDPKEGAEVLKTETHGDHLGSILPLAFSPNGSNLAFSVNIETIALCTGSSVKSKVAKRAIELWNSIEARDLLQLQASHPETLVFSQNGSLLLCLEDLGVVTLRNNATGLNAQSQYLLAKSARTVALSFDESRVAVGSINGTITLWDLKTSQRIRCLTVPGQDSISAAAFSPDGSMIAYGSEGATIGLWDLTTGQMETIKAPDRFECSEIRSIRFTVDSKTMVTNIGAPGVRAETRIRATLTPFVRKSTLIRKGWIQRNGRNYLWLPLEYRLAETAFCEGGGLLRVWVLHSAGRDLQSSATMDVYTSACGSRILNTSYLDMIQLSTINIFSPNNDKTTCKSVMKFAIALEICSFGLNSLTSAKADTHPGPIGQHMFTDSTNSEAQAVLSPTTQCLNLKATLGGIVQLPDDALYRTRLQEYWASNQIDLKPYCRIMPRTSTEAAAAVRALNDEKMRFAVESGGHSSIMGASNINDGVTLDLSLLDGIALSPDGCNLHVGTGMRWLDVYEFLEREDLSISVNGARAGSVGVGGFLLGGGISISSGQYGWACDSIESVEVIIGNGSLVEANTTHHSRLSAAMKGTASVYGIATSFKLKTYPAVPLEMAFIAYNWQYLNTVLSALEHFNKNAASDKTASADLSVSYDPTTQENILVAMLSSTNITASPALSHFHSIPKVHYSRQRITNAQLARILDVNNPHGYRQHKATLTITNDATLLAGLARIFAEFAARDTYAHVRDQFYRAGMLVQPLTLPHLQRSRETGKGNMLGLEDEMESLICRSIPTGSPFFS
ncbi:hypothetical protein LTR84_005657 [Exophiala bonariae]|uniref:FAD-binding PCMH-type domain-containing protein n=1 Tax=Exophiala bonariae TaxID=1690606 RepID=A0AAV9N2X1_9EURO|nr:hypothetical protein LTR84_005657 [Exophiala bonariae]